MNLCVRLKKHRSATGTNCVCLILNFRTIIVTACSSSVMPAFVVRPRTGLKHRGSLHKSLVGGAKADRDNLNGPWSDAMSASYFGHPLSIKTWRAMKQWSLRNAYDE